MRPRDVTPRCGPFGNNLLLAEAGCAPRAVLGQTPTKPTPASNQKAPPPVLTNDQIKKLYAKAQAAQKAGRLDDAAKGYTRILKANPNVAEAQFNMARIAARKGAVAQAAQHFEAALRLKPGQPDIWRAYLDMASRHPNPANLETLLGRAGRGRAGRDIAKLPEGLFYRGLVAARRKQPQAAALIRQALDAGLTSARAQTELGVVLSDAGDTDAAVQAFNAALKINPSYDFPLARLAELYRNLGQTDKAQQAAKAAIEAAPTVGQHYYTYASLQKMQAGDPVLAQMEAVMARTKSADRNIVHLGHALAKAMEDTGQTSRVFGYLKAANTASAKAYPYDHARDVDAAAKSAEAYLSLPRSSDHKAGSPTPIFVTGMPRSGTTLVEQIIASHSKCEGAGELSLLGPMMHAALAQSSNGVSLSAALGRAAQDYRAALAQRFPNAAYVTDKSISSYASIGFIRHAMPDAKIIVVRRDPADNALSIYKNMFREGTHRHATDLRNIAKFYKLFDQQVAFWADQTPDGFAQIKYEDLIADPDTQSRQLVANAGLEWEEACLSFYDNARRVDTLSATQVRRPIYASSVGAWRRHEADMAPFLDEYGYK